MSRTKYRPKWLEKENRFVSEWNRKEERRFRRRVRLALLLEHEEMPLQQPTPWWVTW